MINHYMTDFYLIKRLFYKNTMFVYPSPVASLLKHRDISATLIRRDLNDSEPESVGLIKFRKLAQTQFS